MKRASKRLEPRTLELVHPSYQPSRSELREDLRMGSTWEDFARIAKALVHSMKERYTKHLRK